MQIYNTAARSKQPLSPLQPPRVTMYVCGMTVYDYCHVGHARVLVVFDMVARHLRARGYEVHYVRNITDIDDKILRRAQEQGEDWRALTERFIAAMHEDAAALRVLPPDAEPRATDYIAPIIDLGRRLEVAEHAYAPGNGDLYYAVRSFPTYGRLAGKSLDDLRAGARVEIDGAKRDPLDFVLWKAAKPQEPSWPSPWGAGRPGWHIECSAMSMTCLGEQIDLHGGGGDLAFPHHENEIAQSEGATGKTFAQTWMHVGFVQVNEEKMSKSLGNFFTIRAVLERYQPEVLRYFILASHYRSPLSYSDENLELARQALERFYLALQTLTPTPGVVISDARQRFDAAMDDDFNTPQALSVLFELVRDIHRLQQIGDEAQARSCALELKQLGGRLGLLQEDPALYLRSGGRVATQEISDAEIEALIAERISAKQTRDFARADALRQQLLDLSIQLEDGRDGTRWRRL